MIFGEKFGDTYLIQKLGTCPRIFIFLALCALMIFLPLPFGSVDPWAIFVFEAATLVLFGLHTAQSFRSKKNKGGIFKEGSEKNYDYKESDKTGGGTSSARIDNRVPRIPLFPKLFLGLFFAVTILQLVPLPPSVLKILSPQAYHIHLAGQISQASSPGAWHSLSLSQSLTAYELLKYVCYFLFARLVFLYVRSRRQIEIFFWVMMGGALFQALYGLAEYFGGTHRIFGWNNVYFSDSAFGTFVNRNHFAGFFEMVLPLSLGYLLAKAKFFSLEKGLPFKQKILWFGQEGLQKTVIFGIVPVILGIGLLYSRSRSGLVLFFISIFLMIIAVSAASGETNPFAPAPRKRSARLIRIILLLVVFSVALIGINPVINRLSPDLLLSEGRPILYKYTLGLIDDFPFFGTGPGTYVYTYPKYEKIQTPGLTEHAHNDYFELLAESGAIGGGCLLLSAFGALGILFAKWARRRDYFVRGTVLGCMAGIAAILVHSAVDFNLRIPANAVYFLCLYALGFRAVLKDKIEPGL